MGRADRREVGDLDYPLVMMHDGGDLVEIGYTTHLTQRQLDMYPGKRIAQSIAHEGDFCKACHIRHVILDKIEFELVLLNSGHMALLAANMDDAGMLKGFVKINSSRMKKGDV